MKNRIVFGENLDVLRETPDASIQLIYVDPPFNTGKRQSRPRLKTTRCEDGDRVGYKGQRYKTVTLGSKSFADRYDDYCAFLGPRLEEARRVLADDGAIYVHLDYREVHYVKVMMDEIFGRECFMNEIVWAYDYGARTRKRWPAKHDNILYYAKDPGNFVFNAEDIQRIPYMAPGLVGPEKAKRGKLPTDTWWHTIVSPNGKEKTGYPTQKPLGVLRRIVQASSNEGDTVLDFFAGSGTAGVAAAELGRRFVLVDNNPEAIEVMKKRFAGREDVEFASLES